MPDVTESDVQRIIDHHRGRSTPITHFSRLKQDGFDAFTPTQTYKVSIDDGTSYLLKTSLPISPTSSTPYVPNNLEVEHTLLKHVASNTDVPLPTVHAFDASASLVPYTYLLLAHPRGVPLALALASGKLSPRQLVMLDLRAGAYLKQLHERVQNDWFGLPTQDKDELYSWQEAFTLLVEGALEDAREVGVELPYEDLRRYLSRAIGFFLFDDCEVPSLVSFTGDAHATFVDVDLEAGGNEEDEEVRITSFVSFGHALWGDPLLETMFLEPSAAFVEGYGGPLVVFARQKTKRMWYTLFLALIVLLQAKGSGEEEHDKVKWATEMVEKCVVGLKDAPCY